MVVIKGRMSNAGLPMEYKRGMVEKCEVIIATGKTHKEAAEEVGLTVNQLNCYRRDIKNEDNPELFSESPGRYKRAPTLATIDLSPSFDESKRKVIKSLLTSVETSIAAIKEMME